MTTYTIFSDSTDDWIYSTSTTYATARSGAGLIIGGGDIAQVGQAKFGADFEIYEGFVSFDTSGVVGVISAATLSLHDGGDSSTTDFTVNARRLDYGTLTTADWIAGASLSGQTLVATKATSGWTGAAYNDFTSQAAFLTQINQSGTSGYIICSSRHEGNNTPTGSEYVSFDLSSTAGTSSDPKLVVVAAAVAAPPPFARNPMQHMLVR